MGVEDKMSANLDLIAVNLHSLDPNVRTNTLKECESRLDNPDVKRLVNCAAYVMPDVLTFAQQKGLIPQAS